MCQIRVAIIGAGVSGICAAVALRRIGGVSFSIFEKGAEAGGTWRDNTYPGVACDLPSRYYTFSFALGHDWPRSIARGAEVLAHVRETARTHGIGDDTRFGTEVTSVTWDEESRAWWVETASGARERFDAVVAATGFLRVPRIPEFPGRDSFTGPVCHTSQWDHAIPGRGGRIAVIGTGASGTQVVSSLAGRVEKVIVFQRTPSWFLPFRSFGYSAFGRLLYRRESWYQRLAYHGNRLFWELLLEGTVRPGFRRTLLSSACRWHLRLAVRDRELRSRLTPDHAPLCRRGLAGGGFYRALRSEGTELVDSPITRITATGLETLDGRTHAADAIVLATGFDAQAYLRPITVRGTGGVTLEEEWRDGPAAYLSMMVPGFPNFFLMQGPYSPAGSQSSIAAAEIQAVYLARCVKALVRDDGGTRLEPTREATREFLREVRAALPRTVWASGCRSYYLGPDGLPILWPWSPRAYRRRLSRPVFSDLTGTSGS